MKYPFVEHHRVAIATTVADHASPTVAELNGSTDITCDLTKDGLRISRSTQSIARPRWSSDLDGEDPTRYGVSAELEGYRFTPPEVEPLWDAASTFRAAVVLIVRRGVEYSTAWAAGQSVEVISGRWGKRSTAPSGPNRNTTFQVPILVTADDDAAEVAA